MINGLVSAPSSAELRVEHHLDGCQQHKVNYGRLYVYDTSALLHVERSASRGDIFKPGSC